ncbi:PREDICTED: T-complex-associated testis-expressed protein 1-like [Nicrophorus vespilloides]|uniref:T-complex-associated testis-expressed protein 1-like n=1 Tax=Nicrophorus vespilloides TaxID=110193 RepID=A0ABM1M618_NICVS|nr:PREDICTED: T-complex-associated testis-expressed protein 1-like [Nicrophorus vespilloides]
MRLPYIINQNTYIEYDPSQITRELLDEVDRVLISEDITRTDDKTKTLVALCILCIGNNFEQYPLINDLLLCADRDNLLEILPTNLPLSLVVPLIEDEIYWKRRFTDTYGVMSQRLHEGWTWKCVYLENHMQELVEKAQPEYNDEETMEEITTLIHTYVHRLIITQLQCWRPPLTQEKDEIPEIYPVDHINMEPIFRRLSFIEEIDISFGTKDVGESFKWQMFKVSLDDAKRLGTALVNLKKLRVLSLHNSSMEDKHIQILTKFLIKIASLEELRFSYCLIGDKGTLCIAKLMMSHAALSKIVLTYNKIGAIGGEGIGYALMQDNCCPIKHLDLRLNPLGHQGIMGLFRALVRVNRLEELIISGCGFEDETSIRLGAVLQLHKNLKMLDVSNNWLLPGEKNILEGMMLNNTLCWMDLRETDITDEVLHKIKRKLDRNRRGDFEDHASDEEEEIMEEVEEETIEEENVALELDEEEDDEEEEEEEEGVDLIDANLE